MEEQIQSFLDRHSLTPSKITGRSFIFDCPGCGGKDKLYIQKKDGLSICFKQKNEDCPGPKTKIARVLSLLSGVNFEIVKKEIEGNVIVSKDTEIEDLKKILDQPVQKILNTIEPMKPDQLPLDTQLITWDDAIDGLKYLQNRGLDKDLLSKYGVMYSASLQRVIFPVIMNGNIYGWQGRTIDPSNPLRMHNLPGEWRSKTLMFHDNLKNSEHAIIAEGAISALKFTKVGGFVATMGKMITQNQINLIKNYNLRKIYIALDPDAPEESCKLALSFMNDISYKFECYLIKVPMHREDFGDCTYEECVEAFLNAERLDGDCWQIYSYIMEREDVN
jgi:hypothetical protein